MNWATVGVVEQGVTSYSDDTVASGGTVSYRVVAFNSYGDGAPSDEAIAKVPAWPAALAAPKDHLAGAVCVGDDGVAVMGSYFTYEFDGIGNRTDSVIASGGAVPAARLAAPPSGPRPWPIPVVGRHALP